MAHTNQTAHYHLPQFVGSDILNPLTDLNGAFEAIDTALYEQGQGVADVVDDIDALKIQNGDSALDTTAQTLSGAINELKSGADALGLRVTNTETDVSTLQTQMSTATGNITTLNTSVAGLQTEMASKASATALNNLTVKVGTGNLNTTAQNCVDAINEVLAELPSGGGTSADEVTYDNTDSGITATNVQDAIDELKTDIDNIPTIADASDVSYDNTTSGMTATNVQSALDEVKGDIDTVDAKIVDKPTVDILQGYVTAEVKAGILFVNVKGYITTGANTWVTVGQLPAGYRPAYDAYGMAYNSNGTAAIAIIASSGDVQIHAPATTSSNGIVAIPLT